MDKKKVACEKKRIIAVWNYPLYVVGVTTYGNDQSLHKQNQVQEPDPVLKFLLL